MLVACLAITTLAGGCHGPEPDEMPREWEEWEHRILEFDTLVTTASGLVGRTEALAVAPDGTLWLADALNHHVLVLGGDGVERRVIGREGAGPGEFSMPVGLAVSGSSVLVFDYGNRRVQRFELDSEFVDSEQVSATPYMPVGLNSRGDVAVPTLGYGGLVLLVSNGGPDGVSMGEARADPPQVISPRRIREQARSREMPSEFRNNVLPIMAADGGLWIVVQSEGVLERYSSEGRLMWSASLPENEVSAALDRFFEQWDGPVTGVPTPQIARSGAAVGDELWLMMDEGMSGSMILVLDGDSGAVTGRLSLNVSSRAGRFAVDQQRQNLFISLIEEVAILHANLPAQVTPP